MLVNYMLPDCTVSYCPKSILIVYNTHSMSLNDAVKYFKKPYSYRLCYTLLVTYRKTTVLFVDSVYTCYFLFYGTVNGLQMSMVQLYHIRIFKLGIEAF